MPAKKKATAKSTRQKPKFRRVLLKISGEVLGGKTGGICPESVHAVAAQVREVARLGVQIGVVVGGGNIFRGLQGSEKGIERATGDYMGMLATVINSMALQDALEKQGVPTRVQSAIKMEQVAETYIPRRAMRHLEKGRVVILAGGTGHPYFTTDTTAALRALELDATLLLKATKVRGVYSADPKCDPKAQFLERLSFQEVLVKRLRVMDWAAISLCMENKLPIVVFNMTESGNIVRALHGERLGTLVE